MEQQIPGLVFAGFTSNPQVNGGRPVLLYEFAERTDGRPSINTVEGWNALVEAQERRHREKMSRAG